MLSGCVDVNALLGVYGVGNYIPPETDENQPGEKTSDPLAACLVLRCSAPPELCSGDFRLASAAASRSSGSDGREFERADQRETSFAGAGPYLSSGYLRLEPRAADFFGAAFRIRQPKKGFLLEDSGPRGAVAHEFHQKQGRKLDQPTGG